MDKFCQNCQAPLAADAPRGLCPACLMKVAMATGTVSGPEKPGFTPPSAQELAMKFPQLEIIELIGRGGMGAVYKARQKELDRIVALKILPPGIGDDTAFAERFAREAKALARLNHPGIVTIHDFGRADGLYFFVMEFVDGVNLRQLLASARVSPREALAIVPQICDALQFAHDQGIVHRDIKPENILLDRRGRVKVADFGLAKLVESNAPLTPSLSPSDGERVAGRPGEGKTPTLTDAGKVMGTPAYMAPEQVDHPSEVDHRADIYALGVVFYQMLTGELPGKRIEPPSSKVQIDVRLDEVVLRALEKKPELRYQQVSEVKTMVETIVNSGCAPAPSTDQVRKRGSRWSWIGSLPKLGDPLVLKRGNRRVFNWPVIGVNLLIALCLICVVLPIMLKGMSFNESRANLIALLFLGLFAVALVIRVVGGLISPFESPPAEPGLATNRPNEVASHTKAAKPRQAWWTWWWLQSPEAGQICAHLTKEERKHLLVLQLLYSVWVMATIFGIPALNRSMLGAGAWTGSAVWAGLFIASLPMIARMMRHFFSSTDWARKQGVSSDKLRLFSFRAAQSEARGPALLVLVVLLLALLMLEIWGGVSGIFSGNTDAPQIRLATKHLLHPSQAQEQRRGKVGTQPAATFGPEIERVIPDPAEGTACVLDFETGNLLQPPPEVARALSNDVSTFGPTVMRWLRDKGGDAVVAPDGSIQLIEGVVLNPTIAGHAPTWEELVPSLVASGIDGMSEEERKTSIYQPAFHVVTLRFPAAMEFTTRERAMGVIQILGASDHPRGVRIRYRLVRDSKANVPFAPSLAPADVLSAYAFITSRLEELKRQQSELLLQYTEAYPLVQNVRDRIGKLTRQKTDLEQQYPALVHRPVDPRHGS